MAGTTSPEPPAVLALALLRSLKFRERRLRRKTRRSRQRFRLAMACIFRPRLHEQAAARSSNEEIARQTRAGVTTMTVRVLMKRVVRDEDRGILQEKLRDLRRLALRSPGYISGETLFSVEQPGACLVISTWISLGAWRAYDNNPDRMQVLGEIGKLLIEPQETTIWVMEGEH